MSYYAINGSPRKNRNTAALLERALEGVTHERPGARTELVHVYDLPFQSCISCFQCKLEGGKSYGRCHLRDELTPVLDKLAQADGLIFGSPLYYGNITGKMKSFLERLLFQYSLYDLAYTSLAPRRMPTGFIYTMNVTEEIMNAMEYKKNLKDVEFFIGKMFREPRTLHVTDTYQFDDYSRYRMEYFSEADKARRRAEHFPLDLEAAFELGRGVAGGTAVSTVQPGEEL